MRTIYVDLGELDQSGALGLFSSKVRILPAGAVIRTEQAEIRAEVPRYQEMAERAGVFFFFEDEELPELPFFAVPGLELAAWDRGELFQFRRDTTDWCGRLADLLPPEEPGDARRALHQGACGLYHLCCHNFLHGRSREAVAEACKAAVFLLQAKLYAEQGLYCRRRSDLEQHLTGQDLEILQTAQALKAGECREDLTALTDRLFAWCRDVIGQQKAI